MRRVVGVGILAGLALPIVACSDEHLDAHKLEAALPSAVLEDHPEVVTQVVCPDDIEPAQGVVTVCFADVGGRPVELTVTQTDDDGSVRVEVDRALLDVDDLSARIADRLTDDIGVATSVVCDEPPVRVLEIGDEIRCDATDPDHRELSFLVTILDDDAAFSLRLD